MTERCEHELVRPARGLVPVTNRTRLEKLMGFQSGGGEKRCQWLTRLLTRIVNWLAGWEEEN